MVAWWVARRAARRVWGGGCSGEQPYTGGRYFSYDSYCSYDSYLAKLAIVAILAVVAILAATLI